MARITVEDCIDKFPSRFELVLVSSQRARKLHAGEEPTVDKDNDKNTVIALREIADETISIEEMKNNLIENFQTFSATDEEEDMKIENPSIDETEEKDININNSDIKDNIESISENHEKNDSKTLLSDEDNKNNELTDDQKYLEENVPEISEENLKETKSSDS